MGKRGLPQLILEHNHKYQIAHIPFVQQLAYFIKKHIKQIIEYILNFMFNRISESHEKPPLDLVVIEYH